MATISAECEKLIKDKIDIVETIHHFVPLKKEGHRYKACCPFHGEKTPSFSVDPRKGLFKCFGCGIGGDAIKFYREHEKKTYVEALEFFANKYSITIDYAKESEEQKKQREQKKDVLAAMSQAIEIANLVYQQTLIQLANDAPIWQYIFSRGYTREEAIKEGFGYAPVNDDKAVTSIINKNLYQSAIDCGIISLHDSGEVKPFYRNRLTIPIHNSNGNIIGLAGRYVPLGTPNDKELEKKYGKYINPKESLIYQKQMVLFGLHDALAAKAFRKNPETNAIPPAYLMEGYLDVKSLHSAGIFNALGYCGGKPTEKQLQIIQRYTNHLIIFSDADATGSKTAMELVDKALKMNFMVQVVNLANMPGVKDPHDFVQQIKSEYHATKVQVGTLDGTEVANENA